MEPIALLSEIPSVLHESMQSYLETHPDWDQDRLMTAALSQFLLQNIHQARSKEVSRVYLDSMFKQA